MFGRDSIGADIKMLGFSFIACNFLWVRRETNNLAYMLAKFAYVHNYTLCCSKTSLPLPVYEAWLRDYLLCTVV